MPDCLEEHHDPDELCWDYEMILMVKLFHSIREREGMTETAVWVAVAAVVTILEAVVRDGSSAI
jgi:hypothetical protein